MGAFKEQYFEDKELTEAYISHLNEEGYVLDDNDLDFDTIEEDEGECTECVFTDVDVLDDGDVNERLFKKIVVRGGVKKKKWFSTDPNKKIVHDKSGGKPKEVVKKAKEKIARKKGALKGKIKRKVKGAQSKIRARLSRMKRKIFGIH